MSRSKERTASASGPDQTDVSEDWEVPKQVGAGRVRKLRFG
jgi:hypothetical protein